MGGASTTGPGRAFDAAKLAAALVAYAAFAVGAIGLLGLLVPPPTFALPPVAAALVTAVSALVIRLAVGSLGRSARRRAGDAEEPAGDMARGVMELAWVPILLGPPLLAVIGPTGRLGTYPGAFLVIAALTALPLVTALRGQALPTVSVTVGWTVSLGSAFWAPPPWPDVATTLVCVAGWTAFGVLTRRRSGPRGDDRAAAGSGVRRAAAPELDDRRRRRQDTVRIPGHKGRKGISIGLDRRRWVVSDTTVEVGRAVLVHRPDPSLSPLAVSVDVRRSTGRAPEVLRSLTGVDDPGAIGPQEPEVHRSPVYGEVLCALVRTTDDGNRDGGDELTTLTYAWRVGAHVSDVRVRTCAHDVQRVLLAVEDLDALVAAVRFL